MVTFKNKWPSETKLCPACLNKYNFYRLVHNHKLSKSNYNFDTWTCVQVTRIYKIIDYKNVVLVRHEKCLLKRLSHWLESFACLPSKIKWHFLVVLFRNKLVYYKRHNTEISVSLLHQHLAQVKVSKASPCSNPRQLLQGKYRRQKV